MANHVWTRTVINSDKEEVHSKLLEWYGEIKQHHDVKGVVEPIFGKDWDYDINLIGSKWIVIEDCTLGDAPDTEINFCSAWSPPIEFMEEFTATLVAIDDTVTVEFTGDEESDDFLFAGYGSKNGFHCEEDSDVPERPFEEECEEDGTDYDELVDEFYDECCSIQNNMLRMCKKKVEENDKDN